MSKPTTKPTVVISPRQARLFTRYGVIYAKRKPIGSVEYAELLDFPNHFIPLDCLAEYNYACGSTHIPTEEEPMQIKKFNERFSRFSHALAHIGGKITDPHRRNHSNRYQPNKNTSRSRLFAR